MFIGLLMLYVTLRLPETKDKNGHNTGSPPRIEYASAALLLLSVATPLSAINLGGEIFPWDHPVVLTLLGITPVFIALFYLVETRVAITPIVPKRFLHNRNIAIALVCTLPMKFVFDQVCRWPSPRVSSCMSADTRLSCASASELSSKHGHSRQEVLSVTGH